MHNYGAIAPDAALPSEASRAPSLAPTDATAETTLTREEQVEYERGLLTWSRATNWRFWVRWKWVPWYLLIVLFITAVCLVGAYHRQVRVSLPADDR